MLFCTGNRFDFAFFQPYISIFSSFLIIYTALTVMGIIFSKSSKRRINLPQWCYLLVTKQLKYPKLTLSALGITFIVMDWFAAGECIRMDTLHYGILLLVILVMIEGFRKWGAVVDRLLDAIPGIQSNDRQAPQSGGAKLQNKPETGGFIVQLLLMLSATRKQAQQPDVKKAPTKWGGTKADAPAMAKNDEGRAQSSNPSSATIQTSQSKKQESMSWSSQDSAKGTSFDPKR